MPPSDYAFTRGGLTKHRDIQAAHLTILFRAENIRPERTGIHAKVSILVGQASLAWSNFNIERDEDRLRLANSAYKHIAQLKDIYPPTYLKADLDEFCLGLWDAQLSLLLPEDVYGSDGRQLPAYLLRPYILTGGGTIVFAPPGRGKSYVMMLMAVCLDAGIQAIWPLLQQRVLLINLERSARSVADRLGNINEVLGLQRRRPIAVLNARGRSLTDVIGAADRYIEEHDIQCVFLDSISRAGLGDLNDNQSVNRIIDNLNGLCPTWLALAHTPRSDETHLYGSIHFEAGADVVVQLLSEQEDDGPLGIGLQIVKNNDVGKQPLWIGALEFDPSGLRDLRRARPGEFAEIEANRKMSLKEAVRQHLLDVGPADASQIAQDLGFSRTNVTMALQDGDTFIKGGKVGRRQLYAVRA